MSNTLYELWMAGNDKMELYGKYTTEQEAISIAKKKKELGYMGSISIYKVTSEKIKY